MSPQKANFDYNKKIPLSKPLFSKKGNNPGESNVIEHKTNDKSKMLSEYDLSGLNDKLLLTETNPKKELAQMASSNEEIEFYIKTQARKETERQYLNDKYNQIKAQIPKEIMVGVNQGIGNSLQEIESNIANEQLSLSPVPKSVNELIPKKSRRDIFDAGHSNTDSNDFPMTQDAIKVIKDLKEKQEKIKRNLFKLENNQKSLEQQGFLNISNSIIETNIRNDKIRELKGRKVSLLTKLEEINYRVQKLIEENKPFNGRNEKIKQFIENYDIEKDDYPAKKQQLEKESLRLKEQRLNDLSMAQQKKKKHLDQIEKQSIEQRERLLTELQEKEHSIVKRRKQEMDSQMDKTKQYIKEQVNKTERDYLFFLSKEKFELEQKKQFDKAKMQTKEELITKEEYMDFTRKLKENKIQLIKENEEKLGLMKEMWKNRSQILPSFKSNFVVILEEENKKAKEEEELMIQKRQQQIREGIEFATEHIPQPTISKALKKERESRIHRLKNKRNAVRKRYLRKTFSLKIPKVHKKTNTELPYVTNLSKPLKQLTVLPNYLDDLKKKRDQGTSPVPMKNLERELNNEKGTIIENVELLKLQTEDIERIVHQKKQYMKENGGYAKQSEIGDQIGDLLIDSIKAKLMIINKLKGK